MVLRVALPKKVIHYTHDDRNGVNIQNAVFKKIGTCTHSKRTALINSSGDHITKFYHNHYLNETTSSQKNVTLRPKNTDGHYLLPNAWHTPLSSSSRQGKQVLSLVHLSSPEDLEVHAKVPSELVLP
jgi:hypothetical protein